MIGFGKGKATLSLNKGKSTLLKISVVIPCHNGEKYLSQAIESVLAQTHRNLELLVVDDGSTDGSAAIMARYASLDKRARVVSQENRGVAGAGNRCLREARCDWVARLDADDVFLPDKLGRQIRCLRDNPNVKVLGTAGQYIDQRGRILAEAGMTGPFDEKDLQPYRDGKRPLYFIHSSVLMHRKTILDAGGYRVGFAQAEDTDLWSRLVQGGHLLLKIPESLVQCRIHGQSISIARARENRFYESWALRCMAARSRGEAEPSFGEFVDWLDERPWFSRVNARRVLTGEMVYQKAALAYAGERRMESLFYLLVSMAIHPHHVIPRVYLRKIRPVVNKRLKIKAESIRPRPDRVNDELCAKSIKFSLPVPGLNWTLRAGKKSETF